MNENTLKILPWEIAALNPGSGDTDFLESIFSQGNGYMGIRGYSPIDGKNSFHERSTFLAGFFEYIRPGITDMVNQPDFSYSIIELNGEKVTGSSVENRTITQNMRDGSVIFTYSVADGLNRKTDIRITRFLSVADKHAAAIRFEFEPKNHDGKIVLTTGIDARIVNLPIADNQLSENTETASLFADIAAWSNNIFGGVRAETRTSKRKIAMEYALVSDYPVKNAATRETSSATIEIDARQGARYVIDKLVSVYSYRDVADPVASAKLHIAGLLGKGFAGLLGESGKRWDSIWEDCDVELAASDEIQGMVRYNIFQLIQTAPLDDPKSSIGARGLMHGRYKGCYFWDTEIFVLPLFLHAMPGVSKNLLFYRYNTLNDAVESAKRFTLSGARYSWMASDTGFEQCETWDTGCCEIHITADVAYAFGRYLEITGDKTFFEQCAAEVFIETARYWVSRFTYDAGKGKYNLLFVKGPDEYCGVTSNNLFTVKMAQNNLLLACKAVTELKTFNDKIWKQLSDKIRYSDSELIKWLDIINKINITYDCGKKLYMQDDTFASLEPLDIAAHKQDEAPLYHRLSYDRLQRYQVLKQADILMLMALMPDRFSLEEKTAAWDYYEPKTVHDSTLSYGIHALMAARLDRLESAGDYFIKSGFLDLKNIMNNTAREGIHTAALGATWQALVFGFCGLWIDEKGVNCKPSLPQFIEAIKFNFFYRGVKHRVEIDGRNQVKIEVVT